MIRPCYFVMFLSPRAFALFSFSWEDFGFRLIVPHGAVLEGVTVDVTVKSFLPIGGKFKLPENFHLVSAIYEVSSSENFKENVSVQIQHYAIISSVEKTADYTFVTGRHSGTNDPYTFEILNGAFSPHSQLATISLNHFCKLGSVANSTRPTKRYRYAAHAYQRHNPAQPTKLELEFLLTPRERIYEKILNDEYTGWNKSVKAFDIAFEDDSITLGINTSTKVEPHTSLQIEKGYIDDLCEGESEIIPSSKVLVGLKEEQPMSFNVNLLGTKPPRNFFTVSAPPRPFESSKGLGKIPIGLGEIFLWISFGFFLVTIPLLITIQLWWQRFSNSHGKNVCCWIPPACLFMAIILLIIIQLCWEPFPDTIVDTSVAVLALVLCAVIFLMFEDKKYIGVLIPLFSVILQLVIAPAIKQFPNSKAILDQIIEKKFSIPF